MNSVEKDNKKKLVVGITAPGSVVLIDGQLKYFKELGYDCYLMCPDDERVTDYCKREECNHISIKIEREISIINDFKSLWSIFKALKKIKPDVVNVGTPKMGLLGMLASRLLGVSKRVYTCRGLRYEHEFGNKKRILKLMEKLTGFCAQKVICISPSVRDLALKEGVFPKKKCIVINKGSSNGIDLDKFNIECIDTEEVNNLKNQYNLSGKFVFGYVGRMIDRKGINELYEAFDNLYKKNQNLRLVTVGANPDYSQLKYPEIVEKFNNHEGIIQIGYQKNVPLYMLLFNALILPAWWEGFGNVLVQAASLGLPVIGTFGTGTTDAVSNGYNGILVPIKDVNAIEKAMSELFENEKKRIEFGKNGIEWSKHFDRKIIWNEMNNIYLS